MTHAPRPARQHGIVLAVSLIVLAILSLLAVFALRGTGMQERMSANLNDRNLTLQAAESALREGEALALTSPAVPAAGLISPNDCANGVCNKPDPALAPRWSRSNVVWRNVATNVGNPLQPGITPQFIVEYMGDLPKWVGCDQESPMAKNCLGSVFRITARVQQTDRSTVVIQSSVRLP